MKSIQTTIALSTLLISQSFSAGIRSGGKNPSSLLLKEKKKAIPEEISTHISNSRTPNIPFQGRIISGGQTANAENYPFFVDWEVGCGASLIHEDIVLTAAHCYFSDWSERPNVRIGPQNRNDGMENSIVAVTQHPYYHESTQDHDFMVMKLKDPVPASISYPVELNQESTNPSMEDTGLTVLGFGNSEVDSVTLQEVSIPFVSYDTCVSLYGPERISFESMFCAGETGEDSCQGNLGSPILDSDGVQVGIMSWGHACGVQGYPGVYARVSSAYDWIQEQICLNAANPPSHCGRRIRVTLDFAFDDYPFETSWSLLNNQAVSIASMIQGNEAGSISRELNMRPGFYSFQVRDMADDGICCDYGEGGYSFVSEGTGTSISRDGIFTTFEQVEFALNGAGIFFSVGIFSPIPPPLPIIAPSNNSSDLQQIRVNILHDSFPHETAWMIVNLVTGEQVHFSDYGTTKATPVETSTQLNVPTGRYWFLMLDSGNDGICCSYGLGFAKVYHIKNGEEVLVTNEQGFFLERSEHYFNVM